SGARLRSLGLLDMLLATPRAALRSTFGTFAFANMIRASAGLEQASGQRVRPIGIGLLLATPLVLVFGSLFASADPVFGAAVTSLFGIDAGPLVSHAFIVSAFAWVAAGYLWALTRQAPATGEPIEVPLVGAVQVITPLLATAVVFALFVGVQAGNLFGGQAFIEA